MQPTGSAVRKGTLAALVTTTVLALAAACGGGSVATPAAQHPAAAVPAPSCPGTNAVTDGPCHWSQKSWERYLTDLGVTPGSPGMCLAKEVAHEVDFASADAVAKAFPPGTSGKSEQDYITQLANRGMDLTEAQVDVVAVQSAQNNADCSSTTPVQPTTPTTTETSPAAAAPTSTTAVDPILGDWSVTYGAPSVVSISASDGQYVMRAKSPIRVINSSCDLPTGTVIATFTGSGLQYSGNHGLWYAGNCVFARQAHVDISLEPSHNAFLAVIDNSQGSYRFTKLTP